MNYNQCVSLLLAAGGLWTFIRLAAAWHKYDDFFSRWDRLFIIFSMVSMLLIGVGQAYVCISDSSIVLPILKAYLFFGFFSKHFWIKGLSKYKE